MFQHFLKCSSLPLWPTSSTPMSTASAFTHTVMPMCLSAELLSHVQVSATPWTVACQAPPLSMGFSRQGYWSGLPFPSPGELPDPGIKPESLTSSALAGRFFTTSTTWNNTNPWVSCTGNLNTMKFPAPWGEGGSACDPQAWLHPPREAVTELHRKQITC